MKSLFHASRSKTQDSRPVFHVSCFTFHKLDRKGQVLVEAMVALSALTLGYLGILALLNQSLGSAATVSDRNIATYLAAEGIEIVRNLSDAAIRSGGFAQGFHNGNNQSFLVDWKNELEIDAPGQDGDNFNPGFWEPNQNNITPLKYDPIKGYNHTVGVETRFTRVVYTDTALPNPPFIKVRSVVSWTSKGGLTDSITLEDFFFNWQ